MEFEHIFSVLSIIGAVLFFTAGFSAGQLKRGQASADATMALAGVTGPHVPTPYDLASEAKAASLALTAETATRSSSGNEAELARLRAEAKAAIAEIARLKASLAAVEQRTGNDSGSLQPVAMESAPSPTSFQAILGRLSKTKGMRAAVIGDALGLPVASFGDQSESLAGCCGFISQAAGKARDFLQLGGIRRIVIEDERLATLTACSVAGTDLFLATLTSGPGPELSRMVQVLNDVKSFMSQRSPT